MTSNFLRCKKCGDAFESFNIVKTCYREDCIIIPNEYGNYNPKNLVDNPIELDILSSTSTSNRR